MSQTATDQRRQHPEWMMMTVPHSGTRYIKTAFERAGMRACHTYRWRGIKNFSPDLIWWHADLNHWEREMGEIAKECSFKFIVARDPSMIWATWMLPQLEQNDIDFHMDRKMEALEFHFASQKALVAEEDWYIHRVEHDSIEDLGKQAGLELPSHDKRFSFGTYPLKEAVKARDEQAIEDCLKGAGSWKRFKRAAVAYEDFYGDLGYDLWWL